MLKPSVMDRPRFVALDSWRGICALLVALFHVPIPGLVHRCTLVANGYLFVDFFFVLSGFVIASVYEGRLEDRPSIWRFLLRRFGRLWPLHASVLALLVAVAIARSDVGADGQHSFRSIWTNLAMLHGLGTERQLTWNGPSWSIGVEWMLYILFALLALLGGRVRTWVFLACAVGGGLVLSLKAPHGAASTYDFGAYRGLAGFFTGALVSRIPRWRVGLAAELATVIGVVAFVHFAVAIQLAPVVFAVAVYVFAWSNGPLSRMLKWRPLTTLGEWSYSIYMVHAPVLATIWALAPFAGLAIIDNQIRAGVDVELATYAVYVVILLAASAITYNVIEMPGRGWFNRLANRGNARAEPVSAQH